MVSMWHDVITVAHATCTNYTSCHPLKPDVLETYKQPATCDVEHTLVVCLSKAE